MSLAAAPPRLRAAANLAALAALAMLGPQLWRDAWPDLSRGQVNDFFQEWASAKNSASGLPIYEPQAEAAHRWLGVRFLDLRLQYNAHPPTSVLLALPFAALPYREATFLWNLLSLVLLAAGGWIFLAELKAVPPLWALLPLLALLLLANPCVQQLRNGQLNGVLLLLLVLTWRAERRGRAPEAGFWLGLAMAVKLFPGFLLLFFLMRRNWTAAVAAAATFLGVCLAALFLFGPEAFRDYVTAVLPFVSGFRCHWYNTSLNGFWSRTFLGSEREAVVPLLHAPLLAAAGLAASAGLVTLLTAWGIRRAEGKEEADAAFGLGVFAMLLVSPLTWDHSLLLAAPWFFILWRSLPARIIPRCLFLAILLGLTTDSMNLFRPLLRSQLPVETGPTLAALAATAHAALAAPALGGSEPMAVAWPATAFRSPLMIWPQGRELLLAVNLPGYLLLGAWLMQFACLRPHPEAAP